jgi:serine phosphatase RsbU (regulator of sigma subunit)
MDGRRHRVALDRGRQLGRVIEQARLRVVWRRHGMLPPAEFIARLMADVETFRAGAPQTDDITLVVPAAAPA